MAALMYVLLLLRCRIVPFGDSTWVMFDLKRQYVDFYSYYKRIFGGGEGILYSFEAGLGSGMIGFFIYYLANPLFLLFLPFRTDRLPLAVSFAVGVTIVLAAVIMAAFLWWYLGKRSTAGGLRRGVTAITGAMAWSFSGFLIAHSMNIMWTDVVILVPLVIYLVETAFLEGSGNATEQDAPAHGTPYGRRLWYTITITLLLLFNYYISYQVLLFTALWTLVRLWENRSRKPLRTILS
ncbi:MAG: YfhO family protein, partial [Lachnospiraceae bacterium]|nr:YfhO family protein [Lachnospiraceae bacterium]